MRNLVALLDAASADAPPMRRAAPRSDGKLEDNCKKIEGTWVEKCLATRQARRRPRRAVSVELLAAWTKVTWRLARRRGVRSGAGCGTVHRREAASPPKILRRLSQSPPR